MTVVQRATLLKIDEPSIIWKLALFRVEAKVYRWVEEGTGQPVGELLALKPPDFQSEHDALKWLRVTVDGEPFWVGWDLTVYPVEPPAADRAADQIMALTSKTGRSFTEDELDIQYRVFQIIQKETQIDKLVEHLNLFLTYRLSVMRKPKPPGLDMAEAGMMLELFEDLEKVMRVDLSNLKAGLALGVNRVQAYTTAPKPPEGVQ